jgi:hypothetical protein
MSKEPGLLRAVLGPALVAMAALGLVAFFLSPDAAKVEPDKAHDRPGPMVPAAPEPQREPEPEQAEPADLAAAEPQPADQGGAAAAGAVAPDASSDDAGAITPELRRHAQLMIPGVLLHAIEEGNLEHVRTMRDQLQAKRADGYMSNNDFEALDLVIDCLERAPDARDEAKDFLQFGSATILGEALKRACTE